MMPHKHKVRFAPVKFINGTPYIKKILLTGVRVPSKFSIDRLRNNLFFCINSDEFSNQSFYSVILNLDTGLNAIIPSIRNGYASAVDPSGSVYIGGSDGIYRFNYDTRDVDIPGLLVGVDICDMYFHKCLYFVETASQSLFMWKDDKKIEVEHLEGYVVQHFLVNTYGDILFVNPSGVHMLRKGTESPISFNIPSREAHFHGVTTDANGESYLIGQDGMYTVDMIERQVVRITPMNNGYGLAFDKDNNIIYSNERYVAKLICQAKMPEKPKNP